MRSVFSCKCCNYRRINASRKAHKESIHRRPKGHRVAEVKEKVQIVDLDKKAAPKEKPGIFRGIFRRMFRRVTGV